jgi:uncharacterized protein
MHFESSAWRNGEIVALPESSKGNMLAGQASPYLLQHAHNPVHWQPWSPQVFAEARDRDCPVLLSIGYAACHWCHVMAHESFENADIAALMNKFFVNVKVDREERPDIDQVYMNALHAMGEQGGWPLTMFLDADGQPFWGGTYFPPEPRYGRQGFPEVLQAISAAWQSDRDRIAKNGEVLRHYLADLSAPSVAAEIPDGAAFAEFTAALARMRDFDHGGLRGAPKFPNAPMMEIWFRAGLDDRGESYREAFLEAIRAMSLGGIYDHIGGGLARYSVDESWLVPHFEKMLYDNAHYLRQLVWANQLTPQPLFRRRIAETIAWLMRDMRLAQGGFASSLDADSEGVEGRYYVWTPGQLDAVLGDRAAQFAAAYDITVDGNFEGTSIANRLGSPSLAEGVEEQLAGDRLKLLQARYERVAPMRDDKVLSDWNGYLIRSLAEAGFALEHQGWIDAAMAAFRFITESVEKDRGLAHSWREGIAVRPPLASDIAALVNAAVTLHQVSGNPQYLDDARRWLEILTADFTDGNGGYYLTSIHADPLLSRPRCDADDANPSPASQLVEAMSRCAAHLDDPQWLERAHRLAANLAGACRGKQMGIAGLFNAADHLRRHRHIKIFAPNRKTAEPFLAIVRAIADPDLTFSVAHDKSANYFGAIIDTTGIPVSAVICRAQTCSAPFGDPEEFRRYLMKV